MVRRPQTDQEKRANAALGKRIAALRKERGLTQVELAERLDVIQSVISSYEIGRVRPAPEMILKLSSALDVSADQLLGRATKEKPAEAVDRRFLRRLRLLRTLPKRDQDALLRTIDAFLAARKAS